MKPGFRIALILASTMLFSGCVLGGREHVGPAVIVASGSRTAQAIGIVLENQGVGEGRIADSWVHAYDDTGKRIATAIIQTKDLAKFTLKPGDAVSVEAFEGHPRLNDFSYVIVGLKWFNYEVSSYVGPLWERDEQIIHF